MQQNIQEIEKVCLQFQYAEPSNIQSLQNQLLEIFKSPVSHDGLMPLLTIIFELYNYSKSEYVRKLAITHLKSLLCTKHHLFTKAELVQITTLQTVPYITAISSVLGWLDSEDYPNRFNTLLTETQVCFYIPIMLLAITAN
ncbi:hypothetical protein HDV02_006714 [Globomyces sp. JEL0801]|nr:hypothetical protein HDV02_006714 [Globomyces sp. JEL0801]